MTVKNAAPFPFKSLSAAIIGAALTFGLEGCTYRLPPISPPTQERIRIVAKSPDLYVVQVYVDHATDYPVPADGRVIVGIPSYRPSCGVYLFNAIKVSGAEDPLRTWTISVTFGRKSLRKLSVKQLEKLATDTDGYHLIKFSD